MLVASVTPLALPSQPSSWTALRDRVEQECRSQSAYLVEGREVGLAVVVNVFRLVTQNLAHEVVQDVREAAWNGELLNVLAGHCL